MGKRGTQAVHQNARKHGLYSSTMTKAEKLRVKEAEGVEGLDDELAILRVKLCSLLENQPDRIDLQIKAINMISRLVKTRYSIAPKDEKTFENAASNLLREVGILLGMKYIP